MIRCAGSSASGYKAATSSYSWAHTAADINDPKELYGILVGVGIFGAGEVYTVTATFGGITRNFSRLKRADNAGGGISAEVWFLPDVLPNAYTIEINLSGLWNSAAGACTYAFLGGFGNIGSFTATAAGINVGLAMAALDSILFASYATELTSGVTDIIEGQNRRVTNEGAGGSHCISDIGPTNPIPEGNVEIEFGGGVSTDDLAIAYVELLNNYLVAPSIG